MSFVKLSIQDLPLMELFVDQLSRVVDLVFAICRNNTGNFLLVLVIDINESCDLDGDTVLELLVNCFQELQLLVPLTICVIVFRNHFLFDACSDVTI